MARAVEVEWQYVVRDVDAFGRWLAQAMPSRWSLTDGALRSHADVYYDTDDWALWRAGWALRLRTSSTRSEATLKATRPARRGVARRREITTAVRNGRPDAVRAAAGMVGRRVRRLAGADALHRLFGLRTRRRTLVLRYDGHAVGEIALDRTRIAARGRVRRLARVEIEVMKGPPALVARFVATLRRRRHLTIATRSKFEEGLRTARLAPPPRH